MLFHGSLLRSDGAFASPIVDLILSCLELLREVHRSDQIAAKIADIALKVCRRSVGLAFIVVRLTMSGCRLGVDCRPDQPPFNLVTLH